MWRTRVFSWRCAGLALISLPSLLVGCHRQNAPPTVDAQATRSPDVVPVQQSPLYRAAVRQFARHDYPAALAGVNALLRQPQYQRRPADLDFLRQQQAICRHALDPHAAAVPAPAASPAAVSPVTPHPVSQADCGPRALLLLCPQLGVHTSLDTLRKRAGTTAAGTSLAGLAQAAQSVGLKARGVRLDRQALSQLGGPAVAWVDGNHYVALLSIEGQRVTIHDPNQQMTPTWTRSPTLTATAIRSTGLIPTGIASWAGEPESL